MVYKKYDYRATQYKVPAQQAGEYIDSLIETEGGITPRRLLDVSRSETALLHSCFEWDDTKAAEAHRISQARYFIGNLVCVVTQNDEPVTTEPVRAYVNVKPQEHAKGNFKHVISALSDDGERKIVLENAKRDARIFKEKYAYLKELADVFTAIDEFIGGVA